MVRGNWKVQRGRNRNTQFRSSQRNQRLKQFPVRYRVKPNRPGGFVPRSTLRRSPQQQPQRTRGLGGRRGRGRGNFKQRLDNELDNYWGNKGESLAKAALDNEMDSYWKNKKEGGESQKENAQNQENA